VESVKVTKGTTCGEETKNQRNSGGHLPGGPVETILMRNRDRRSPSLRWWIAGSGTMAGLVCQSHLTVSVAVPLLTASAREYVTPRVWVEVRM
jgi:hypothetical protein